MRKLEKKETLGFINSKNKSDLITFLSKFNNKIYRVDTVNETTGEGTYDLYESNLSDSFDVAFELGIKPVKVGRLKA
tara:strand:- start:713 stop:943 length:231 start_codon:yes stop_codon:yes gene_type:complete